MSNSYGKLSALALADELEGTSYTKHNWGNANRLNSSDDEGLDRPRIALSRGNLTKSRWYVLLPLFQSLSYSRSSYPNAFALKPIPQLIDG